MTGPHPMLPSVISDSQRLRRIAELLCKAIVMSEAEAAVVEPSWQPTDSVPTFAAPATDQTDERRVVGFLRLAGEASPASIRFALGLSRSATYRALQRLNEEGQILHSGQTRSISYRLSQGEPPLAKIELN